MCGRNRWPFVSLQSACFSAVESTLPFVISTGAQRSGEIWPTTGLTSPFQTRFLRHMTLRLTPVEMTKCYSLFPPNNVIAKEPKATAAISGLTVGLVQQGREQVSQMRIETGGEGSAIHVSVEDPSQRFTSFRITKMCTGVDSLDVPGLPIVSIASRRVAATE